MSRLLHLSALLLGAVTVLAIIGFARPAPSQIPMTLPAHTDWTPTAIGLLSDPIGDSMPNAVQLRRGQYLVAAADCMSCHLREGGEPLAGGLGMKTPFGVIYSANITSDQETGIGAWSSDQFYRAMHDGIGSHGENLYPAFPYPWFRRAPRDDDDAILAFLKTTPAVRYSPPANHLRFPLNFRFLMKGWNLLFLKSREFQPTPGQSSDWNRGAYLVTGFGHCGGCHTPLNRLGAPKSDEEFYGATLDYWVAPDLTSNDRTGLGDWSIDDIAEYLHNGRNIHAGAGGAMADVVSYSTSLISEGDRRAVAIYLKSLAARPIVRYGQPDSGAMSRGAAIFSDACTSCHLENGVGQPTIFPPLGHNAMLQQADATGLEHLILAGTRIGSSPSHPSPLAMPSFAWKLSDSEISDVTTYIRNSWGNQAAAVSTAEVRDLRQHLDLETVHPTANPADRN